MSWLQPTERDTDYFAQLQAGEHEQLRRYAQVLAMAARIDPHLLRSLRLRFLPDSSAELELALWFCDVISSRNATGADMYPGVARLLCDELRVDAGRYEQVKGVVKQLTQHWRAAEQLEQAMRWAVLEEDTATLQQSYQRILHQLQTTSGAFEKREIARWAKGALATTLDKEQPLQEATWLYQYVAAALGSPGQWLEWDVAPLPDELRLALPEGRTQRIGVRVYPGVLQFVKPDEGDLDVIEVNLPLPTSVQVRFDDGEPSWESIWYGRVLRIPYSFQYMELLTLSGCKFNTERIQSKNHLQRSSSDIFVSYAHIDNKPSAGQDHGWITRFIDNLGNELGQRLGRTEHYDMLIGSRLQVNDQITPVIEEQLRNANILLIMMSRGWLASEWCVKELECFCKAHEDSNRRIFVVDQGGISSEERPEDLRDLLTYPFYKKTPQNRIRTLVYSLDEREYFDRIVDLSYQLANAMHEFAERTDDSVMIHPKATVYVSPVSDSLFDQRLKLIRELERLEIRVLPETNQLNTDIDITLAQCSHFIQLLDDQFALGIPHELYLTATGVGITILQWRDPKLDYSKASHEQIALLEGKSVQVCELKAFCQFVSEAVSNKLVFVHACPQDFKCAVNVANILKNKGFGVALPRYEGEATLTRKSIERGYQFCDILLIIQREGAADVIEDYLSDAQINTKKSPPILLCQCEKAEELFFIPPGVTTFRCENNFLESDCIDQILEANLS